jgi:hypothetical protein
MLPGTERLLRNMSEQAAETVNTRICFGTVTSVVVGSGGNHLVTVQVGTGPSATLVAGLPTVASVSPGQRVAWLQSSTGISLVLGALV